MNKASTLLGFTNCATISIQKAEHLLLEIVLKLKAIHLRVLGC
jgi:hypothetical protein